VARWHGKSLSRGQLAKIDGCTALDGRQPDAWRDITEGQDAGQPADITGYRSPLRQTNRAALRRSADSSVDTAFFVHYLRPSDAL
jgi:hypothetical protein